MSTRSTSSIRRGLLPVLAAAARQLPPATPRGERPRLLVLRPDHLGDVLMTTAVLRELRQRCPGHEIVALVGPWSAPVLQRNGDVDRVLAYPFPWFDRQPLPSVPARYAAAGALAATIRALGVARAYLLRGDHWWGALAAALAGVPERVGYGYPEVAPFLTCAYAPPGAEHVVRSGLRLVAGEQAADTAVQGNPRTCFAPSAADRHDALALLVENKLGSGKPYVLLHPGASLAVKRWPVDRWAAVVEVLVRRRTPVLLVAGPAEQAELGRLAAAAPRDIHRIAGAPSLGVLAGLLERARVALGVDSAPMHLATAVGTPTLRLFGPGDETLFGPWGDPRLHHVVRAPGTSPDPGWFGASGGPHPTMLAITPSQVVAELDQLLRVVP